MSRKTPLFDEHERLGARMVDFHGWSLPVQYEGVLAEHRHCRCAAALFDTSHMGQLRITAPPEELGRVLTQNAASLAVGRDRYGLILNNAGGIRDDSILMRLGERDFLLVVNAGPAEADLAWLRGHLPDEVRILDQRDDGWGKLDLQGPASAAVLDPLTDADLAALPYFRVTQATVAGQACILSRTGYTGELGYEIFAPEESIRVIWGELLGHAEVEPAGLGARDSLRLEAGLPLYGSDVDETATPFEAGLEGFVRFDHPFIGSEALQRIADERPPRRLAAFRAQSRQRAWPENEIWAGQRKVGAVTSAAFAPSLDVSIGMGYAPPALTEPGTELVVKTPRGDLPVTLAERPLYEGGTARARFTRERPRPDAT
jgi:aminomethyltransferase